MVAMKARASSRQGHRAFGGGDVSRMLAHSQPSIGRAASLAPNQGEPRAVAALIAGKKDAKPMADLSLEMMDVDALDTGHYQAMVIQDPSDKRNMSGFFHLAVVGAQTILQDPNS